MPPGSTAHRARHQQPDAAEQFGPADEAPKPAQQPHAAKHFHGAVEVAELVEACFDEEQGQGRLQDPGDDVADGRAHRKVSWVRADENGRCGNGRFARRASRRITSMAPLYALARGSAPCRLLMGLWPTEQPERNADTPNKAARRGPARGRVVAGHGAEPRANRVTAVPSTAPSPSGLARRKIYPLARIAGAVRRVLLCSGRRDSPAAGPGYRGGEPAARSAGFGLPPKKEKPGPACGQPSHPTLALAGAVFRVS